MINRQAIHDRAVAYTVDELRARGCLVDVVPRYRSRGVTLSVVPAGADAAIPVAVRAGRLHVSEHHTTVRGRVYHYGYAVRHFNLHIHGERITEAAAWVLVALDDLAETLIVPGAVLADRVSVEMMTERRRGVPAWWQQWVGRWGVVTITAGRCVGDGERVDRGAGVDQRRPQGRGHGAVPGELGALSAARHG